MRRPVPVVRHAGLRCAAAVAALIVSSAPSPIQPVPVSAVALLDRYERGEYEAVLEAFATARDAEALRKDLEKTGVAWTTNVGPDREPRRRLVAATMALELAHARKHDEWLTLRSLVEWGCQLLRTGVPSDTERRWQLASIALAGGSLDDALPGGPDV